MLIALLLCQQKQAKGYFGTINRNTLGQAFGTVLVQAAGNVIRMLCGINCGEDLHSVAVKMIHGLSVPLPLRPFFVKCELLTTPSKMKANYAICESYRRTFNTDKTSYYTL